MCRRMCNSDSGCVAFSIGRVATQAEQDYLYEGTVASCCLERRLYPPGAYMDGSGSGVRGKNGCQLDGACWTCYERAGARGGGDSPLSDVTSRNAMCRGGSSSSSSPKWTPPTSGSCVRMWEPIAYTDDDILERL